MSTLVSILLGLVLSILPAETLQQTAKYVSQNENFQCSGNIKNLRSNYLISKDELVFELK
ncbi:MAG: hypothetical protein ACI9SJ_000881 [Flavobacteriaceae bacterium]|jgi:hypothetical protein|uniref:hypothetical protein n=1 Tax=Candidatus Marifrigoribacter sp. Uisw_064 TaxID=3230970 RepID=UPI003AD90E39